MNVSDFDYTLPDKRIAQTPPKTRGTTRLLVLDRRTGEITHSHYADLAEFLRPGDLVILNDTKVIKARLLARNADGKERELLLLEDHHNTDFTTRKVLYRGKIHADEVLDVSGTKVKVEKVYDGGIALISASVNLLDIAEKQGTVPLPPYMHREATKEDTERYQTVFAREPGSVAAPTASLNFTDELLQKLKAKNISIAYLTLHVGLGTFLPIRTDKIEDHEMHSEYFEIPKETIAAIQNTKKQGGRIITVGTTVTRTLEFAADNLDRPPRDLSGEAQIFIYPGYKFKAVDVMLTNFHAPKSTVLMMAAAFSGWDNLKRAYEVAIEEKYDFLSYGDSMLIS